MATYPVKRSESEDFVSEPALIDTPRGAISIVQPRKTVQNARRSSAAEWIALALLLAVPIGLTVWALRYYGLPFELRVREPLHRLLRPSGLVGQSLGLAGLAMFLFMWLYPIRKNIRALARLGSLASWLRVHVVVGLALPVIVAVHAGWRFHGLVGLGYLSMVIVCLSGIIGRYLYSRIPRHRNGLDMSREEVINRRRTLVTEIAARLGLTPLEVEHALESIQRPEPARGAWDATRRMLTDGFVRARAISALRKTWLAPRAGRPQLERAKLDQALALAAQDIHYGQQLQMLAFTQRIFHYWHVAHRPFAITALIAVLVHVTVAYFTGATWLG
jgi:hypothetical protein